MTNFLTARLCASLLVLGFFVIQAVAGEVVPVLQTKTDSYQNVTLISRTATHAFIQHARGVATIKLSALDAQALNALGLGPANSVDLAAGATQTGGSVTAATGNSASSFAAFTASLANSLEKFQSRLAPGAKVPRLDQSAVLAILGGLVLAHFCFCYCAGLICKKTGNEPGILIWLPVFNMFPLLRAASMSGWWFLAMCVPVLGLVVPLIWCFKISQARGKGVFTAILLILPVTNFFAFLYLAFANGKNTTDADDPSPGKSYQSEPLPA